MYMENTNIGKLLYYFLILYYQDYMYIYTCTYMRVGYAAVIYDVMLFEHTHGRSCFYVKCFYVLSSW